MTKAVILKSSPSRQLINHGEVGLGENNISFYLVMSMNFYSKKKLFPLKFHKHKGSFCEMKKKEKTQMVLTHILTLDCFIISLHINCLSYQNISF